MPSPVVTTGDLVSAADWNAGSLGILGYAEITADISSITTTQDLAGLAVTGLSIPADRRIRITGSVEFAVSGGTAVAQLQINESTTQLQRAQTPSMADGSAFEIEKSIVIVPSAGAHSYKLRALRVSGTGALRLEQDPTYPAFIVVEDIGSSV